jgi:phosphate starvation-inducible protein PhoH
MMDALRDDRPRSYQATAEKTVEVIPLAYMRALNEAYHPGKRKHHRRAMKMFLTRMGETQNRGFRRYYASDLPPIPAAADRRIGGCVE